MLDSPPAGKCHTETKTIFECAPEYAQDVVGWSAVVVVLYAVITVTRFIPAALRAERRIEKLAWGAIAFIFPFCAMTGYACNVLSGCWPDLAYSLKVHFLRLDVLACLVFWWATRKKTLSSTGLKDALGVLDESGPMTESRVERARKILREGINHTPRDE